MTGSPAVIRIGPFAIDPRSGEVRQGADTSRLQPQALALLLVLVEEPGRVVTREELRRRLWPDTTVAFDDGLNHAVARLRDALHDSAHAPKFIETVPRKGYRFVGVVEAAGPGRAPNPEPAHAHSAGRRRLAWTAAGLLAVVLTAGLAWRSPARGRSDPGIRSIAVLPLANLSPDRSQDYFGDGITEELITELARSESLRVLSRTSTLRYRGSTKAVPQIAGELGVDALVEGSVQRVGDRVRVAAQLVRGSPEEHLWAQSFEGGIEDIFAIRTRVAQDVMRYVGGRLPPPATTVHEPPPAAYEAFLIGRSLALQNSRDGYAKSIGYFERAIALDDRYALAYADLAASHAMVDLEDDRRSEHFERARELSRRAVELAPDLGEARLREAHLRFYWDWDWSQCDSGFRLARDLSPRSGDTREYYALCLCQLGRYDEALREFEHALEVEPLSARSHDFRATLLSRAGRHAEAIEELRRLADLQPAESRWRSRLAFALIEDSRAREALEVLTAASRLKGEPPEKIVAVTDAWKRGGAPALLTAVRAWRRQGLERWRADLEARARTERVSPIVLATAHAVLGNLDRAFELLDQAYRERCPQLAATIGSPRWDNLRSDPRFTALLRRMKHPAG
jgi:TolB-like protein/DNA-binding winged helix-turn-helix (wHTH) protein/tetratricopeptide (TPR) repeat protein